jgi:hypothetical protein
MSAKDSSNTHEVIGTLFRAMNTKIEDRESARIPRWADTFPYVNGGLFSGNMEVASTFLPSVHCFGLAFSQRLPQTTQRGSTKKRKKKRTAPDDLSTI